MESWKKHLHGYEFMLWNFDRFDINSSVWVKQAFEAKKYAFAADYIRLYALYHYGGIYLDMDVEVIKPFDDLLDLPYFAGREIDAERPDNAKIYPIEAATIGAEKGCFWVGKCLDYYKDRKFDLGYGKYDVKPLPFIIYQVIKNYFRLIQVADIQEIRDNTKNVYVLPADFFSPKRWYDSTIMNSTTNTYSIHHYEGSWKKNLSVKEKIRIIIGKLYRKLKLQNILKCD
jgi:hypothetical protein